MQVQVRKYILSTQEAQSQFYTKACFTFNPCTLIIPYEYKISIWTIAYQISLILDMTLI